MLRRLKSLVLAACMLCTGSVITGGAAAEGTNDEEGVEYAVDGGYEIVNGDRFYIENRVLNGTHVNDMANETVLRRYFTALGDNPEPIFVWGPKLGNMFFGLKDGKWFRDFDRITSRYVWGHQEYILEDESISEPITITFVRANNFDGLLTKITLPDDVKDKLVWAIGGNSSSSKGVTGSTSGIKSPEFDADDTKNTTITISDNTYSIKGASQKTLNGTASVNAKYEIKDASEYSSGLDNLLNSSSETSTPMLVGTTEGNTENEIYLMNGIEDFSLPAVVEYTANPSAVFDKSINHFKDISTTIEINTPDKNLNSVMVREMLNVDLTWNAPFVMHGYISWHQPFSGWQNRYPLTLAGWSDYVQLDAMQYRNFMDDKGRIRSVPKSGYASNDRYNMSEQFVDQLLYDWKFTNDMSFMTDDGAYDMIKKHLNWMDTYMQVDGTNLYESFLDAFNTDNKWNNGGAGTNASVYTWYAYKTTAELAEKLGYTDDAEAFKAKAELIRNDIFSQLWVSDKGVLAEYKDLLGHKRVHDAPDLTSIYTPIDQGILDPFQAYQALKYSENYIERVDKGENAQLVYSSNWPPEFWSSYLLINTDMANLMAAYYKAGQIDSAEVIRRGMDLDGMSYGNVTVRAITEGMFGIYADAPNNQIQVKPELPREWQTASIKTPHVSYSYDWNGTDTESLNITNNKNYNCNIYLPARKTGIESVTVNGADVEYSIKENVGNSYIVLQTPTDETLNVVVKYSGGDLPVLNAVKTAAKNNQYSFSVSNGTATEIYDPQDVISSEVIDGSSCDVTLNDKEGYHTFFVKVENGEYRTWLPVDIEMKDGIKTADAKLRYENDKVYCDFKVENNTQKDFDLDTVFTVAGSDLNVNEKIKANSSIDCTIEIEDPYMLSVGSNIIKASSDIIKDNVFEDWNINSIIPGVSDKYNSVSMIDLDGYVNQDLKNLHTNTYNVLPNLYFVKDTARTNMPHGRTWWENYHYKVGQISGMTSIEEAGVLETDIGVPFKISDVNNQNAVFTSLYENFPDKITIPIDKMANKLYFLLTISTNNMQSRIENAKITVNFDDGTSRVLSLSNPENIDDWLSYSVKPYAESGAIQMLNNDQKTHANILDINIGKEKKVKDIELECMSNEVLAGLLGITAISNGVENSLSTADALISEYETYGLSKFYGESEYNTLKEKAEALRNAQGGLEISEAVKELESAIENYKNSSNVKINITPESAFVDLNTTAVISSNSSEVEIKYTLDGSEPTKNSASYIDGIKLEAGNNIIKAAAFYNGVRVSDVISKNYLTKQLEIGEYVSIGTYRGESLIWRIVGIENGNPLLITDRVLSDLKEYDAAGTSQNGSHKYTIADSLGYTRQNNGSNNWMDSNIHDWLNSEADAGEVVYSCGNEPSYKDEAGFLNGFTDGEKSVIKSVEHKNIVTKVDSENATGGLMNYPWTSIKISEAYNASTYNNAYYVTTDEKIFLPDVKQLYDIQVTNASVLGSNYAMAKTSSGDPIYAWTRTPMQNGSTGENSTSSMLLTKNTADGIGNGVANAGKFGVRPMMYIDINKINISSGNGTADEPYVIKSLNEPQPQPSIELTFDKEEIIPDETVKAMVNMEGVEHGNLSLYLALYRNDILVELVKKDVESDEYIAQAELILPADTENCTIKSFLWNSEMNAMTKSKMIK